MASVIVLHRTRQWRMKNGSGNESPPGGLPVAMSSFFQVTDRILCTHVYHLTVCLSGCLSSGVVGEFIAYVASACGVRVGKDRSEDQIKQVFDRIAATSNESLHSCVIVESGTIEGRIGLFKPKEMDALPLYSTDTPISFQWIFAHEP